MEYEERDANENLGEDLGSSVVRKRITNSEDAEFNVEPTVSFWQQTEDTLPTERKLLPPQEIPSIILKAETKSSDGPLKPRTPPPAGSTETQKVKKKKKKRRDEIDAIFGLL